MPTATKRQHLGKFITARLKELGWTQDDLILKTGLSRSLIQQVVKRGKSKKNETLVTIREAIGVSAADFPAAIPSSTPAALKCDVDAGVVRAMYRVLGSAGGTVDQFVSDALRQKLSA